jgi:hypothetical protein
MAGATAAEIAPPIIIFWEGEDRPSLFGSIEAALLFIRDDAGLMDDAEVFDCEGRRLQFRLEGWRRAKWWHFGRTLNSDFEVDSLDTARLRARLGDSLREATDSPPRPDSTLAALVDEAYARWIVD